MFLFLVCFLVVLRRIKVFVQIPEQKLSLNGIADCGSRIRVIRARRQRSRAETDEHEYQLHTRRCERRLAHAPCPFPPPSCARNRPLPVFGGRRIPSGAMTSDLSTNWICRSNNHFSLQSLPSLFVQPGRRLPSRFLADSKINKCVQF